MKKRTINFALLSACVCCLLGQETQAQNETQTQTISIGDKVWYDVNKNGRQDSDEPGVSGVSVKLFADANMDNIADNATPVAVATTNANGNYVFCVPPGKYFVQFPIPVPAGYSGYTIQGANGVPADLWSACNVNTGKTGTHNFMANYLMKDAGLIKNTGISGRVYNDNNAGTPDGNAFPNATVTLYAANGTTVLATAITDAGGNYSFVNQGSGNYVLGITLPPGYQNVSSTDATPADGKTSITVSGGDLAGINFGINQPPTAINDNLANQVPGSAATIANILNNDNDPNNGVLSPGDISLTAPSGAMMIISDVHGDVLGFTVPGEGTWWLNSNTGAVTFTPQNGFSGDPTPITYRVRDSAGLWSALATITIDYNTPAVTISGTVRNDNSGMTNGVDGNTYAGATVTLYAANGTTVLATTTTDASGNYSFANQIPGNYVVGITPPAGYNNVSSTDAAPTDGKTSVTVGSTNVTGINFGINQPPAATNDNLASQTPGSAATIANLLANDSDPNGGTLSKDSISLVAPAGATGIVTDGQGDVTGFTVPGQGTWSLNSTTGAVTFTPQGGFTGDPTPVTYTVTDNAGLTANPATITIDYTPVPDLTPIILLPVNALNAGDSRDFVVRLNEVHNVSTSGQIALNISVPAGYTLSFPGAATSTSVLLAGTFTVSNSQWNTFNVSVGSVDLQSKPGFSITANGNIYIGFRISRVSALPNSVGNVSVNIYPDNTKRYDSNNANNLYHRVVTAN